MICDFPSESGPYKLDGDKKISNLRFQLRNGFDSAQYKKSMAFIYEPFAKSTSSSFSLNHGVICATDAELFIGMTGLWDSSLSLAGLLIVAFENSLIRLNPHLFFQNF